MIERTRLVREAGRLLRQFPVVALLGARQVGKSTLARAIAAARRAVTTFDLEHTPDLARLEDASLTLGGLRGLVVIDEVQRRPELFPTLRVLADRGQARFLLLGSASPDLLRQSSESLAGRIAYLEMGGFALDEVDADALARLWVRGGFPRSFLAASERASLTWRRSLLRTFLERDLPSLGVRVAPAVLERFWKMIAHWHGELWNGSELGRSLGLSEPTVRHYLDLLSQTFALRVLRPFHENLAKRQVKSPKVYVSDSGLLHALLDIRDHEQLLSHPKLGASWEGFLIQQVVARLGAERDECFFWRTHEGAELDLLIVRGGRRFGFEFKRTDAPRVTPSMRHALADLGLDSIDVVHAGAETFPLAPKVRAVAAERLLLDLKPLRA
ncbi:MAG: ATP-binding protein [Deltaproteobacteria bacterium]|nr:ATP-binding protein [Deltaproteobacteria bacterium]